MADNLKCPKCAAENPKENRFCDTCGAKLGAAPAKASPEKQPERKKADKGRPEKAAKPDDLTVPEPAYIDDDEEEAEPAAVAAPGKGFAVNREVIIWIAIFAAAIMLRFIDLGVKPMHHDESMHAFYSYKLFKGDGYSYNPMLHGPFLFHANALAYFMFGVTDYSARIFPAIYGILCLVMVLYLRPYLGKWGAIFAGIVICLSPIFVYQSRYIRNDIYIAGDTLMLLVGLLRYFDTKRLGWLMLAAVGLALSWATKEVTYITLAIFGSFLFFRWIWEYSLRNNPEKFAVENKVYGAVEYWLGKGKKHFIYALLVFLLIHACFYFNKEPGFHNFFRNLKGIWDGYTWALIYWLGQHGVERGSQPIYFYALLIPFYEMHSVFFMLMASVYFIVNPVKRTFFNIFCIYWWIMSMLIYSWAGERMPWLAIHPLVPMSLLAGQMAGELYRRKDWGIRRDLGLAVFVLLAMASLHGAVQVSFFGAGASPKESLVYVQSTTDTTHVAAKIEKFAYALKSQKWESQEFRAFDPYNLEIVCEDYCTWPFAWYLREFKKIAYQPRNIPESEKGKPIILSGIEEAARGHDQRVYDLLKDEYYYERYKLRDWWAPDEKKWWSAPLLSKPGQQGKIEMLWRRFMYREVWNDLGSYDFVVYIRKDLKEFWQQ
ncbi:MAG TPA: TIGR03663 family protein [bacterium]|nr:TIGR03663 family protein [bacterium]